MTDTQPQDPQQAARLEAAAQDEQHALNQYLQNRVILLNVEVRTRDEQIVHLEGEKARLEGEVATLLAERNQAEPTQDDSPRALLDTAFPDPSTGS